MHDAFSKSHVSNGLWFGEIIPDTSITCSSDGKRLDDPEGHSLIAGNARVEADQIPGQMDPSEASIEFRDAAGCQVGRHNLQYNSFIVRAETATIGFDEALERPGVAEAIRDVVRHPGDPAHRAVLVDALADTGWLATAPPLLKVGSDDSISGLLLRALTFDVTGMQIGDHNTQHNTFRYVVAEVPTGDELLRGNTDLAEALADVLVPAAGGKDAHAELAEQMQEKLAALDVEWVDGRDHGVDCSWPKSGHTLLVSRVDGATVGDGNTQRNEVTVEIDDLTLSRLPSSTEAELLPPPLPADVMVDQAIQLDRATPPLPPLPAEVTIVPVIQVGQATPPLPPLPAEVTVVPVIQVGQATLPELPELPAEVTVVPAIQLDRATPTPEPTNQPISQCCFLIICLRLGAGTCLDEWLRIWIHRCARR